MNFQEYQKLARQTAIYPNLGSNYVYPVLGLAGEAGEVAEKFKKVIRDKKGIIDDDTRDLIMKELGDVLWYISNISSELGVDLEEVASLNIDKLFKRKEENKLHGSGDDR